MKIKITILLASISFSIYAQYNITEDSIQNKYLISKLDSMGIDNDCYFNNYESEYFNAKFRKERKGFDFTNKKIAFFNSSSGAL